MPHKKVTLPRRCRQLHINVNSISFSKIYIYIWPYIYIFDKEIEDVDMKLSALNEYITLCIKMIISYNLKLQNNYKHMFIL